jgi:hypothetical protein
MAKFSQKKEKLRIMFAEFSVGLDAFPGTCLFFVGVKEDTYDGF